MFPKEETFIDKTGWLDGPWMTEPDRVEWRSATQPSFACLIVRGPVMGQLCGYVGVPPGHRWHGKGMHEPDVDVHGGLTFAAGCDEDGHICHVAQPGEPGEVWWLGFDCGHCFDFIYMRPLFRESGLFELLGNEEQYRDIEYVRAEVERLAAQCV